MKIALIALLSGALLGVGAASLVGQDEASPLGSLAADTAETGTTETVTVEDRAEDRARGRDRGAATTTETTTAPAPAPGVDISGPCDEAEHANDPRCTGAGGVRVEDDDHRGGDNSGPGSANSGPGNADDDDSGRGRGRGRGRGGDDD